MDSVLEVIEEKKKIVIAVVVGILVFGLIILVVRSKRGDGVKSPLGDIQNAQDELEGELILWDDEAGFTFEYPEDLYVDDHPEDMENYAHLEITSTKELDGKILILVNDATTETIDDWLEESEEATQASTIDTTLAETDAKKLLFKDPKKVLTAVIDPYEALFLIELEPGEGKYWTKVYDQILESFAFKPLTEEEEEILGESGGDGGGGGGGNVVYEEEEVIE
ncbi:hypothetical protein ISS85_04985 [Candidatus Microgenomates bacterium]|nr:hypothetical protein [Candidatus Microgenomates bacterium]